MYNWITITHLEIRDGMSVEGTFVATGQLMFPNGFPVKPMILVDPDELRWGFVPTNDYYHPWGTPPQASNCRCVMDPPTGEAVEEFLARVHGDTDRAYPVPKPDRSKVAAFVVGYDGWSYTRSPIAGAWLGFGAICFAAVLAASIAWMVM